MNQPDLNSNELQQLRRRMRQIERDMTNAESRLRGLGRGVGRSLGAGRAGLVLLLVVTALIPLTKAQEWWRPGYLAPFQVLDDQGHLIVQIFKDGSANVFGLYPPGKLPDKPGQPALGAAVAEGGHVFFKALMPSNVNVNAVLGVTGGTNPGMALRSGGSSPNRLVMAADKGKPDLDLLDSAGRTLVDLGQEDSGGGGLMLTNGTGGTIMQAGAIGPGVGAVAVWPQGGGGYPLTAPIAGGAFALKEENRLPGTFICGGGCAGKR